MHKLFTLSLILKGLNGAAELVLGLCAVFISQATLITLVAAVTRRELLQDPGDAFATYLVIAAQQYSVHAQVFVAVYLLLHGIVKIFLVISLLQRHLWAYPTAVVVFGLFMVYQLCEYARQPNLSLLVLSALDGVVIVLTLFEYRVLRARVRVR